MTRLSLIALLGPFLITAAMAQGTAGSSPTSELTRAQAEAMLGPAVPIVTLTPAGVFDATDPVVKAAYNAWLATVPNPHDRFGNIMSAGYKGALRPDTVNTSILTFIQKFCEGKRLVAFSHRGASQLATQQNRDRERQIQILILKSRGFNVNPGGTGNPPGGGPGPANRPEGVPPLAQNPPSTGGPSPSPSPSESPNPSPSPSPPPTPSPPGAAGDIERKYGVKVTTEPIEFTGDELRWIDEVLSVLPASYRKQELTFSRDTVIKDDNGTPFPNAFGVTFTETGTRIKSIIFISSLYTQREKDFPWEGAGAPFTPAKGQETQFKGTFAHECTHHYLHHYDGTYRPAQEVSVIQDFARTFGWSPDPSDPAKRKYNFDCAARVNEVPTIYAYLGRLIQEDMCDSVKMFLFDPRRLEDAANVPSAQGRSRSSFLQERMELGGKRPPNAAITLPPPCTDGSCDCNQ